MWKNWKMEDLSNFERGQIVGACFAGVSMTKLPHYEMYPERQFLRLCQRTQIVGRQHQRRGTGEYQHWHKDIVVHGEGLFRKITRLLQQNWIFWHELHKSNIHSRSAIAKPMITESNAQMCKRWCHDHKTWTSDNWKWAQYGQITCPSHCSLNHKEFKFENT
jgi:hypothetical protein